MARAPLIALTLIGLLVPHAPASAADENLPQRSIAPLIAELVREGRDGWKDQQAWPRQAESFAADKRVRVANDDLVRVLSRKLQRDPALDAYIKWQLMSFAPDFSQTDADEFRRIIAVTPDLLGQPRPAPPPQPREQQVGASFFSGRQIAFVTDSHPVPGTTASRPRLGVLNTGSGVGLAGTLSKDDQYGPSPQDIARAKLAQVGEFQRVSKAINAANDAILKYRETLARELPDTGGVRLLYLMKDAADRVKAGDPSWLPAIERLVIASDAVAAGTPVPNDVRRHVIEQAKQLASVQLIIVTNVRAEPGGEVVADKQWVRVQHSVLRRIIENVAAGMTPDDPPQP